MVDIAKLAKQYGTPIFLIDLDKIKDNFLRFKRAFPDSIIGYSYKTNFHPGVLKKLNEIGGFAEVISPQEIYFAEKTGVSMDKIIYNGVGRQDGDFERVLSKKLFSININSIGELERLSTISDKKIDMGLRIDPELDIEEKKSFTKTKFGIKRKDLEKALKIIKENSNLKLKVLHASIGTNIINPSHYVELFKLLDKISDKKTEYLDLGGGFASESIMNENGTSISNFGKMINGVNKNKYKLIFEPGRHLVEDACYCIAKVLSVNDNWVITDIAGNFLVPLANANYRIDLSSGKYEYNFGGNLCFGADIIQKNVKSKKINAGDIIRVNNAGAYTFSMRNNLGNLDPIILIKENGKIRKSKEQMTSKSLFESMI